MCGRYALGAAHIDFLEGLENRYPRLFGGRGGGGRNGGGGGGGGPQRLRGGGPGGQDPSSHVDKTESKPWEPVSLPGSGLPKWKREADFWPRYVCMARGQIGEG